VLCMCMFPVWKVEVLDIPDEVSLSELEMAEIPSSQAKRKDSSNLEKMIAIQVESAPKHDYVVAACDLQGRKKLFHPFPRGWFSQEYTFPQPPGQPSTADSRHVDSKCASVCIRRNDSGLPPEAKDSSFERNPAASLSHLNERIHRRSLLRAVLEQIFGRFMRTLTEICGNSGSTGEAVRAHPVVKDGKNTLLPGTSSTTTPTPSKGWKAFPRPPGGGVIITNHCSNADGFLLRSTFFCWASGCKMLYKSSLNNIPFFGWAFLLTEDLPVEFNSSKADDFSVRKGSGEKVLSQALEHLTQRQLPLAVFAEGARSPDGQLKAFRNGFFKLSVEHNLNVHPIALVGSREAWKPGSALVDFATVVIVRGGRPVASKGTSVEGLKEETAKAITKMSSACKTLCF